MNGNEVQRSPRDTRRPSLLRDALVDNNTRVLPGIGAIIKGTVFWLFTRYMVYRSRPTRFMLGMLVCIISESVIMSLYNALGIKHYVLVWHAPGLDYSSVGGVLATIATTLPLALLMLGMFVSAVLFMISVPIAVIRAVYNFLHHRPLSYNPHAEKCSKQTLRQNIRDALHMSDDDKRRLIATRYWQDMIDSRSRDEYTSYYGRHGDMAGEDQPLYDYAAGTGYYRNKVPWGEAFWRRH